jgi:hypothetical protein
MLSELFSDILDTMGELDAKLEDIKSANESEMRLV